MVSRTPGAGGSVIPTSATKAIARASFDRLPEPFQSHLKAVVLTVEEFADDATVLPVAGSRTIRTPVATPK